MRTAQYIPQISINSLLTHWDSVGTYLEDIGFLIGDFGCLKNSGMLESLGCSSPAWETRVRTNVGCMCDRLHQPTIHIFVADWHTSPTCVLQREASFLNRGLLRQAVVDINVVRSHYLLQDRKKQQRRGQFDQHCVLGSALPFPTKIRQRSAVYVPACVVCARVCVWGFTLEQWSAQLRLGAL